MSPGQATAVRDRRNRRGHAKISGMAGDTVITLIGNLTADPELRFTSSGAAVCSFTVASTPRTFDRQTNEWKDGEALFLRCTAWRQFAENIAESFVRGTRVIVSGRLKQRTFDTRDGDKRTVYELDVDEIGPSLRYATATVNRVNRTGAAGSGAGNDDGSTSGGNTSARTDDPWASAASAASRGSYSDEPPF